MFCSCIDKEYVKEELLFHVNSLSENSKTMILKKFVYFLENRKSFQQYQADKPLTDLKLCSTSRLLIFE